MHDSQYDRFFFVTGTGAAHFYPLSLHDALPILSRSFARVDAYDISAAHLDLARQRARELAVTNVRSEEHTSELQSQSKLVCRPLLEKKIAARHRHDVGPTGTSQRAIESRAAVGS